MGYKCNDYKPGVLSAHLKLTSTSNTSLDIKGMRHLFLHPKNLALKLKDYPGKQLKPAGATYSTVIPVTGRRAYWETIELKARGNSVSTFCNGP